MIRTRHRSQLCHSQPEHLRQHLLLPRQDFRQILRISSVNHWSRPQDLLQISLWWHPSHSPARRSSAPFLYLRTDATTCLLRWACLKKHQSIELQLHSVSMVTCSDLGRSRSRMQTHRALDLHRRRGTGTRTWGPWRLFGSKRMCLQVCGVLATSQLVRLWLTRWEGVSQWGLCSRFYMIFDCRGLPKCCCYIQI